jgi:hypothetical protein
MGRKRVPLSQKKVQVSLSLKQSDVEAIDTWTSRRSAWIDDAIQLKINEMSAVEGLSLKELLNLSLAIKHRSSMSFEERAVLERIHHRLLTE